jgi:predicted transcriptional regulator
LYAGTPKDNAEDKDPTQCEGLFTKEEIIEIWKLSQNGRTDKEIADRFGVSPTAIQRILTGRTHYSRQYLPTIRIIDLNPWIDEEIQFVIDNCHLSIIDLAKKLGRSASSCCSKRSKLIQTGRISSKYKFCTNEEVQFIVDNQHLSIAELAEKLGCSIGVCQRERSKLIQAGRIYDKNKRWTPKYDNFVIDTSHSIKECAEYTGRTEDACQTRRCKLRKRLKVVVSELECHL